MTISTRRGLHQQDLLAAADHRDRLPARLHAPGRPCRVGATERQRHVVGFRARRVSVAGRRDAGIALVLKAAAACLIVFSACCERFERSRSKNTIHEGGATTGGGGGGGATSGWPNL